MASVFTAVNHSDVTRQQFFTHRGHTGKKVDPRWGCGGITAGKILPAVGTCTEHRVGLRWAKNPSPLAWVGL